MLLLQSTEEKWRELFRESNEEDLRGLINKEKENIKT